MPLCQIVGCTPTGKTFNVAVAMISHENEETYTWVLQQLQHLFGSKVPEVILTDRELGLIKALEVVFPLVQHSLCWVHVLRKCRERAFEVTRSKAIEELFNRDITSLIMACSEASYNARRNVLFTKWPELMPYVQSVWLTPFKRNIVRFWTDKVYHFDNRTTNR